MLTKEETRRTEFADACALVARVFAEAWWDSNVSTSQLSKRLSQVAAPAALTRQQVAAEFGVSASAVRKWEADGYLQRVAGTGRIVRYSRASVEELLKRRRRKR